MAEQRYERVASTKEAMYPSPLQIFDEAMAAGSLINEREKVYGSSVDNMHQIASICVLLDQCPDLAIKHCMRMIAVKLARLTTSPNHVDSAVDIAGYARIIAQIQTWNEGE